MGLINILLYSKYQAGITYWLILNCINKFTSRLSVIKGKQVQHITQIQNRSPQAKVKISVCLVLFWCFKLEALYKSPARTTQEPPQGVIIYLYVTAP